MTTRHSALRVDRPPGRPSRRLPGTEGSEERRTAVGVGAFTASVYLVLALTLGWSRLFGLGGGYCCDEIATVADYVRAGPGTILAGPYVPNNHELYSLAGWATSAVFGESETALRLLSAIPFIVGVVVVTAWLHARVGPLSGVLYLFLVTVSPLLLDVSRLARGYGLAFLAMSVLVVAALEAERSGRTWAIVAFFAAGLVGTWTLPHFAIAFLATGAVLLARPDARSRCALGLGFSILAVAAWYAPHLDDIAESSRQGYGIPIDTVWLATAPLDQTLVPAMTLIDDALLRPNLESLTLAAAFAVLIGSSPLLRRRRSALILCSGVVVTVVAFWISGTHVVPRFFSFLLVPLFVLVASGTASILARFVTRPPIVRTAVAITMLGLVAYTAAPFMAKVPRLPRESLREAAVVIRELAPPSTPVHAYVPHPRDLEFHLGRPVERPRTPSQALRVCRERRAAVFVRQPWILQPVTPPCTRRDGTRHFRFEQYARGGVVEVWLVPGRN